MLDVILPSRCPACGARGPAPCATCWRRLRPAPPSPAPPGLDECRSLLVYEGAARELVAKLKYRNQRAVASWLSRGMAGLVAASPDWPACSAGAVVTWAPTSAERRRARGFDQAEILARQVAAELRLPVRRLLVRSSAAHQTGRPAAERGEGVTFSARGDAAVASVVLVDDVVTTGATLAGAAAALRGAGARRVAAVTAARTPLKLGRASADA